MWLGRLRRQGHAAVFDQVIVVQVLQKLLVVIVRGGAGAAHAAGGFGIGGVEPVVADVHEGVKIAEERRVAREAALDCNNGVLEIDVGFHVVGGAAVLDVVERDFAVGFLGVFALVGLELPFDLVGGVCHEGHPEGGIEFECGLAEHLERFAHDGGTAFGDAVAMVTEVGIHGIGLLGGNPYDFVTVLLPHLTDGVCAGLLVRGALGECDEVVDLGGGGRGVVVTHGRTPYGVKRQQKALDKVFIKRRCCAVNAKNVELFGQAEGGTIICIMRGNAHRGAGKPNRENIKHSHAYKYSNSQMSKDDIWRLVSQKFL